jgi:hypothetical protein
MTRPIRYLLTVLAASALSGPARAQPAEPPIECLYRGADRLDFALATGGQAPATDAARAARDRLAARLSACTERYRWTEVQVQAAVFYASASANYESAIETLRLRGIDRSVIDQIAADVGEERIAAIVAGTATGADDQFIGMTIIRRLEAAHFRIPESLEEKRATGGEIGQAVAGQYLQRRAVALFSQR